MPRIDMTPMVDLGFLLITFFILTTSMTEKRVTKLVMPDDKGSPTDIKQSHAVSVLVGDHGKVFVYNGKWEDAIAAQQVIESSYDEYRGIGQMIRQKQQWLSAHDLEGRNALVLLIKPAPGASYKNLIDALDEATINDVQRYTIVEPDKDEKAYAGRAE